jgi:hypothetical protein
VTGHARVPAADASAAFVSWLVTGAVGPALVALPVNLVAEKLAAAAVRWFKRCRQTDDLSRLAKAAAAGVSVQLSRDEVSSLRKLLEKDRTWALLAGGKLSETLQELTGQIAGCLPPRGGRTADDASEVASAIARGLLEFAVFELQPEIFQKVVLARLQQMSDQSSALDAALFAMHKDLYHLAGAARQLFRQVMDRLPPVPADLNEVRIYLSTLIDWLNADPWPRDPRLGGPVLNPAAIERKLRVTGTGQDGDDDADELAQQCARLVVLGGPGSGKTWLAMRTARVCAEQAMGALDDGAGLDDVELPLYTTCSRLISTHGDIREAIVSSALNWIGDLGSSRIIQALHLCFTGREKRTLLVIDSLDEASDASLARDRLRQANSLKPPWRVLLTSRPSSWDGQLTIENVNKGHRVGTLLPLEYPDDVEPVIQRWFSNQPEQGQALATQIRRKPSLQQAATVPLILAFYCILGSSPIGREPLPESRHDLYRQVVNRMLYGLWHSGSGPPPDPRACRQALRRWAWRGARNHPVSGIGQWEDDIPAQPVQLSPAGQDAVDHIAAPLGGADFDTDETLRRFVHRSIREHLVAEHVAGLPAKKAIKVLLPHLWYDPDWEDAAPAAIAMHKERDEVLQALLCRASRSADIPGDLSVIDAGGEMRRLLARVAAESKESDWSPVTASIIGQAQVGLVRSGVASTIGQAVPWESSRREARDVLLRQLADATGGQAAIDLAGRLAQLDPTDQDKRQAREALLHLLTGVTNKWTARSLADWVTQLAATDQDRQQARSILLHTLAGEQEGQVAGELTGPMAQLGLTDLDNERARGILLRTLARETDGEAASDLAAGLAQLDPTEQDKYQARDALIRLLPMQTERWPVQRLTEELARLATSEQDARQTRGALLRLLPRMTDGRAATELADAVTKLDTTDQDKRQTRDTLLHLLERYTDGQAATRLADHIAKLDPTDEDKRQARAALLGLLDRAARADVASDLAARLARLDPTDQDKHQARDALLRLLTGTRSFARPLVYAMDQLGFTGQDKREARGALLRLLADTTDAWAAGGWADGLARLDPTEQDKREARAALLRLLTSETLAPPAAAGSAATVLAEGLTRLDPTDEDKRLIREALLALLPAEFLNPVELADAVLRLDPTSQDKRQVRSALLQRLPHAFWAWMIPQLAWRIAELDPTAEDKQQARDVLFRMLAGGLGREANEVIRVILRLDPTASEISTWSTWSAEPPAELLAAARRNTALDEWLAVLPLLAPLSA